MIELYKKLVLGLFLFKVILSYPTKRFDFKWLMSLEIFFAALPPLPIKCTDLSHPRIISTFRCGGDFVLGREGCGDSDVTFN
jgi:hypothetical protein